MFNHPYRVSSGFTRPANTTQYTAKDVVSGSVAKALEFPFSDEFFHNGFWITAAFLISNNAPSSVGSFKLLLFESLPTVPVDHAVFAPSHDQLASVIGVVSLSSAIKISNGTIYHADSFSPIWGRCVVSSRVIYGVLLDDIAYVPASSESFRVVLSGYVELPSCGGR